MVPPVARIRGRPSMSVTTVNCASPTSGTTINTLLVLLEVDAVGKLDLTVLDYSLVKDAHLQLMQF
jgi:hypothetical protein